MRARLDVGSFNSRIWQNVEVSNSDDGSFVLEQFLCGLSIDRYKRMSMIPKRHDSLRFDLLC